MNTHTPEVKPSKYLVCVADSDVSRIALRFACIKGQKRGIQIEILHVIPPPDVKTIGAVANKIIEERRSEAETLLQSMAEDVHAISGVMPSLVIREGNPADEIIAQVLEDEDANMLVLGVNPGTKSGRRIINALANQAGDKLLVPMMLVPGNLTDQQMEALG